MASTATTPARAPRRIGARLDAGTRDLYLTAARRVIERFPDADSHLRAHTGWPSVWDLLRREGTTAYVPTLMDPDNTAQARVCDIFDAAMTALGNPRRAVRFPWVLA